MLVSFHHVFALVNITISTTITDIPTEKTRLKCNIEKNYKSYNIKRS